MIFVFFYNYNIYNKHVMGNTNWIVLCWCLLHTHDLTSPDMTGAWPQHVNFTLPMQLFTYLGFPNVRAVLSIAFIPGFVLIMD